MQKAKKKSWSFGKYFDPIRPHKVLSKYPGLLMVLFKKVVMKHISSWKYNVNESEPKHFLAYFEKRCD